MYISPGSLPIQGILGASVNNIPTTIKTIPKNTRIFPKLLILNISLTLPSPAQKTNTHSIFAYIYRVFLLLPETL